MTVENWERHSCAFAQRTNGRRRKLTTGRNMHKPQWEGKETMCSFSQFKLKGGKKEHLKYVFHVLAKKLILLILSPISMPSSEYNQTQGKGAGGPDSGYPSSREQEMWTPSVQLEKCCHSVNGDGGGANERTKCGR